MLIAGPTASGKSALAVDVAMALGGVVINADSMQVYDQLCVLTARPTVPEMENVPHLLYGLVAPNVRYSVGAWLRDVETVIQDLQVLNQPLVFVGGTGLYFEALTKGVGVVPPVDRAMVSAVSKQVAAMDREKRGAFLAEHDPLSAQRLEEPDPQRVIRAVSVIKGTGRSLSDWLDEAGSVPLLEGFSIERVVLDPGREIVRSRIAQRFTKMVAAGALKEVRSLMRLGLEPDLPAMKAIGVRELSAHLEGRIGLDEAIARAVTASHQYAKRQRTWMRTRMSDWQWVSSAEQFVVSAT